jgi:hypothetical protein
MSSSVPTGEDLGWRKANLPEDYSRSVFYPFSGPDILHPLTFYPEATEIIMFGLSPRAAFRTS